MITIKFRGYNKKNGTWMHGFYLQNRGAHFVCPDEFSEGKSWEDYEVEEETIGQFTGLYDKNGNEIYEGDIVKFHYKTADKEYSSILVPTEKLFGNITTNKYHQWIILSDGLEIHIENAVKYGVIVGNIHDNPDLLKQ